MDQTIKDQLDKLLARRCEQAAIAEREAIEQQRRLEMAIARFMELRSRVIRPAMNEIVDYLAQRGIECWVYPPDRDEELAEPDPEPRISIHFPPERQQYAGEMPKFSVILERDKGSVKLFTSTIGYGPAGNAATTDGLAPDALTTAFLHEKLAIYLADLLR